MPPRTPEQFEELRKNSKEKLLKAAIELFSQEGYMSVSISQIAQQAGVSKGLLYNYFESKESMLEAIIALMASDMADIMAELAREEHPWQRVEKLIRMTFRLFREKKEFYATLMPVITQRAISAKVETQLLVMIKGLVAELESSLQALNVKDYQTEAYKIGALLDGVAWHYLFIYKDTYPIKPLEENIISSLDALVNKS